MSYTDKVGLNKTIQGLKGKVPDLINNFVTEKVLIYEGESIDKTTWFGNNKPLMSDFLRYIYTINNNKVYIPKYMYLLAQLEQTVESNSYTLGEIFEYFNVAALDESIALEYRCKPKYYNTTTAELSFLFSINKESSLDSPIHVTELNIVPIDSIYVNVDGGISLHTYNPANSPSSPTNKLKLYGLNFW